MMPSPRKEDHYDIRYTTHMIRVMEYLEYPVVKIKFLEVKIHNFLLIAHPVRKGLIIVTF